LITKKQEKLDRLFNPRGLALFGGAGTEGSFGHRTVQSQILYGYKGNLYPISKKGGEISGFKVYKKLSDVDGPVDLAMLSLPARAVPGILRQCLAHGVAGVQIHSSGFSEVGTKEGKKLEAELVEIAAQGLRIVGPNCFGIHCPRGGFTILPGFRLSKVPGSLALISQSGGVASDFGCEAQFRGMELSKIVSYGNGCDLDATELLDYFCDDPETEIIAAYIEGVHDGRRFLDLLKKVTTKKPVVIWKAGLTPLGTRATLSHTGSMGGTAKIWQGALAQAGAVPVQGMEEMMDALTAIKYLKNVGPRISLLGGGGAIGVFSSDLAHRFGLDIPSFSQKTQKILRTYFPVPGNSMVNPLDTGTPALPIDIVKAVTREILTREPIDVLIVILLLRTLEADMPIFYKMSGAEPPPKGSYLKALLGSLVKLKEETGKDVAMVFDNKAYLPEDVFVEAVSRELQEKYQKAGIPVYDSVDRALRGISRALEHKPNL
jgi:acyl-CoA synthetase (NDP forming)